MVAHTIRPPLFFCRRLTSFRQNAARARAENGFSSDIAVGFTDERLNRTIGPRPDDRMAGSCPPHGMGDLSSCQRGQRSQRKPGATRQPMTAWISWLPRPELPGRTQKTLVERIFRGWTLPLKLPAARMPARPLPSPPGPAGRRRTLHSSRLIPLPSLAGPAGLRNSCRDRIRRGQGHRGNLLPEPVHAHRPGPGQGRRPGGERVCVRHP